jgi:hypothetical protein
LLVEVLVDLMEVEVVLVVVVLVDFYMELYY